MTPAEVRYFLVAFAGDPPESYSHRWITRLSARMPVNVIRRADFERRGLLPGATRYTAGGDTTGKTLIIGFTGHFHRLMLPTPWFLDCLNPDLYDVVVLRDFVREQFALGIPGLGGDFLAVLEGLRQRLDLRAYRNTIALGTSGGGVPALLAAIALRLGKGIAIGPQDFPQFINRITALGLADAPYSALLASRVERCPELAIAFGADNPVDAKAAAALAARVQAELRPVKRCGNHAVLAWHHERGSLPTHLAKLVGQSLEGTTPFFKAPLVTSFVVGTSGAQPNAADAAQSRAPIPGSQTPE